MRRGRRRRGPRRPPGSPRSRPAPRRPAGRRAPSRATRRRPPGSAARSPRTTLAAVTPAMAHPRGPRAPAPAGDFRPGSRTVRYPGHSLSGVESRRCAGAPAAPRPPGRRWPCSSALAAAVRRRCRPRCWPATSGLPRSTTYDLLAELVAAGFVVHLPEERRYGLGRRAPSSWAAPTSARSRWPGSPARCWPGWSTRSGASAHLAVLHGREVLYVVEERAPGRPPLVTDVGVRLPAQLTASGRAVLADLPRRAGARAVPRRRRPSSTGTAPGRATLSALRRVLAETRRAGYAVEDGEVTPGLASVGAAVHDHTGRPVAGAAVTFDAATHRRPGRGPRWPARCGPRRPSSPGASGATHPTGGTSVAGRDPGTAGSPTGRTPGGSSAPAWRSGRGPGALVLGLPRGGVPVAAGVARALGAPLDLLVVAKLRVPGRPELAMGAVAAVAGGGSASADGPGRGGARRRRRPRGRLRPRSATRRSPACRARADGAAGRAARRRCWPAGPWCSWTTAWRPGPRCARRSAAARAHGPRTLTVAVPVGAPAALAAVGEEVDELVCLRGPRASASSTSSTTTSPRPPTPRCGRPSMAGRRAADATRGPPGAGGA